MLDRAGAGGEQHLKLAQGLLERLSAHLQEAPRARFWKHNAVARRVRTALGRPDHDIQEE